MHVALAILVFGVAICSRNSYDYLIGLTSNIAFAFVILLIIGNGSAFAICRRRWGFSVSGPHLVEAIRSSKHAATLPLSLHLYWAIFYTSCISLPNIYHVQFIFMPQKGPKTSINIETTYIHVCVCTLRKGEHTWRQDQKQHEKSSRVLHDWYIISTVSTNWWKSQKLYRYFNWGWNSSKF